MRFARLRGRCVACGARPRAGCKSAPRCSAWKAEPRGFTLVELFVVISIALIVVAIALPAFSAMAENSNRSLAQNLLRQGVKMARDVSVQSVRGGDGAAVFLFDPESGTTRIISAEWVGTITDIRNGNASDLVERDVFVPVAAGELIELPPNWMVRGYAPARFTTAGAGGPGFGNPDDWYDSEMFNDATAWRRGHWVFPESGFYDDQAARTEPTNNMRTPRQSFMVRFDAQTGEVVRSGREALFVDARPSGLDRSQVIGDEGGPPADSRSDDGAGLRLDWAESVQAWAYRVVTTGDLTMDGSPYQQDDEDLRRALIGNESHDTVLVRDVARVALYDERDLAQALGARELDRRRGTEQTGSLYASYEDADGISVDFDGLFEQGSAFDESPAGQRRLLESIDRWLNGDTNRNTDGTVGNGMLFEEEDEPLAQRYIVDAFSGELIEVTR